MALVGDYDASTFVEGNYATYPPLPPGATYYQPSMYWHVSGAGTVQGQPVVVGDLLFATQGSGRLLGDLLYGDQIYGGLSDGDWTVSQVFFLRWDSTRPPPDLDPYPNAGCLFTRGDLPYGDWAPGWRIVIDAYYNDIRDSRVYGELTYGDEVYGDAGSLGGPSWVDITQPAYSIVTGDGNRQGEQHVVVAEVVIELLDPDGSWTDLAEPWTWYQPQPGTPLRVGFIDPQYRYHPVIVGQLERIEDVHDVPKRVVALRGFGQLMDLVVDIAAHQRPSEMLSTRFAALTALAGWRWDDGSVVFPGDIALHADLQPRDIVVRDELDRTVQSAGWFLDSDRRGRMRVREWPHVPQEPELVVVDCDPVPAHVVPGEPGYLTPTVGTVTTPDPGPPPNESVLIFAVLGPTNAATAQQVIAGQFPASPQRSWLVRRLATGATVGDLMFTPSVDGTSGAPSRVIDAPAITGDVETLALAVTLNDGTTNTRLTSKRFDGASWADAATAAFPTIAPFDSSGVVRIGAHGTATEPWNGRIYFAELRDGLDPAAPTVRYLGGGSGLTVTTADPGPLPRECVFVMKIRGPTVSGAVSNHTVAAQYEADPQRAWLLRRNEIGGYFAFTTAPLGTAAGVVTRNGPTTPARPSTGVDETLAVAVQHDDAADTSFVTEWYQDGGIWVMRGTGSAGPSVVPFDSNTVMRIGAFNSSGGDAFDGRIYSVELRTGLDPAGGTLLWRFDANDYPGTGTAFTDPRGRIWSLSTPTAIRSTLLWRFDANDYPGTGTSYVDPRGRTWTLTAAAAITPKTPDVPVAAERQSHVITYVNDEAQLLNRVLTTNAGDPVLAVRGEDTLSVDRFGERGRALEYPKFGLAFAVGSDAAVWVTRIANRYAYITRRVESLDVDTAIDKGWFEVLVDLDTGRAISVQRRAFHPFGLDAVLVGWTHTITPGRWRSELYTQTVTVTR